MERDHHKDMQLHEERIRSMKAKYLNVLKQMRDDLVKSKRESWQKLEEAWKKRKSTYEKLWIDRLKELRRHIEFDHGNNCRECVRVFNQWN